MVTPSISISISISISLCLYILTISIPISIPIYIYMAMRLTHSALPIIPVKWPETSWWHRAREGNTFLSTRASTHSRKMLVNQRRSSSHFIDGKSTNMAMGHYLYIPCLVGWTSIYQLFWCSPGGTRLLTHPQIWNHRTNQSAFLTAVLRFRAPVPCSEFPWPGVFSGQIPLT